MNRCVIDASALLALLNEEEGSDRVEREIPGAFVSTVNLSEVVAKLTDVGMPEDEIATAIEVLGLDIVDFDGQMAFRAGSMREKTRHAGLSLGDRACLALASILGMPALTADRRWKDVDAGIEIHCIR